MNEKKELIRASWRPVMIGLMILTSFGLIMNDMLGDPIVNSWVGMTLGAVGEWIVERPILKALGKA